MDTKEKERTRRTQTTCFIKSQGDENKACRGKTKQLCEKTSGINEKND